MPINPDFRDLLSEFNARSVRYLVVGGYAFSFHARPRTTKDIDIWVDATPENAPLVWQALVAFGAPLSDLKLSDLEQPGIAFQMGLPPNRVDLLTQIDAVQFDEAWRDRVLGRYGDQPVPYLSRDHLVRNKRALGRKQDVADVEMLEGDEG
jgi:hypothetical protein